MTKFRITKNPALHPPFWLLYSPGGALLCATSFAGCIRRMDAEIRSQRGRFTK